MLQKTARDERERVMGIVLEYLGVKEKDEEYQGHPLWTKVLVDVDESYREP
jgi:hypothetical protein